ncbi:hypothetical protein C8R43DRAFT_1007428 [Mycena crocata]|nr:hypothetical protein C8R43DRAFT_1007428 [Mycena crocata]
MSRLSNLAANGARLTAIQQSIRALRCEEEMMQERLDSYKYPVLTLPNEIVSEIFVHFLPVYPLCPPLTGLLSPTTLTHICHHWRAIALATPSLWRAIFLTDDEDDDDECIVESWLHRSGSCSLSIQMTDSQHIVADEIIEQLLPRRSRLEYIRLTIRLSHLLVLGGPMPLLRDLNINVYYEDVDPSVVRNSVFRDVPLLRSVTLNDFTYPDGFLPWSQLTSLTLIAKIPPESGPILVQAVNLLYCELIIRGDEVSYPDIKLAHLETLRLVVYDRNEGPFPQYIRSFIAPALRTLQVQRISWVEAN